MTILVVGALANVMDWLVFGTMLKNAFNAIEGVRPQDSVNPAWWIVLDFVGIAVFTWFYTVVRSSFSSGWAYGAATAVVVTVPSAFSYVVIIKGWPYYLCWVFIAVSIVEYAVYGMLVDKLMGKK